MKQEGFTSEQPKPEVQFEVNPDSNKYSILAPQVGYRELENVRETKFPEMKMHVYEGTDVETGDSVNIFAIENYPEEAVDTANPGITVIEVAVNGETVYEIPKH